MSLCKPGEIRIPTAADFECVRQLALNTDGWKKKYGKRNVVVYTRPSEFSNFKVVKLVASVDNVSADVMYDTLHDPDYREIFDSLMMGDHYIYRVSDNSDIGYYALKSPMTFANRDFVLQRIWQESEQDYIIHNHSVYLKSWPRKNGFIRAINFHTGYVIIPLSETSCQLTYITQNDPRGHIPSWAVNVGTTMLAPRIMQTVYKAALNYPAWKALNRPEWMPWRIKSQIQTLGPMLDPADIAEEADYTRVEIDETNIPEQTSLEEKQENGEVTEGAWKAIL